jgi:predicted AAA+ superfamily ATPase
MLNRKDYTERIWPFVDKPLVKVVMGVRRCGKSTLLKLIAEELRTKGVPAENILSVNTELMEFDFIKDYKTLYNHVKKSFDAKANTKRYLFLDEPQEVESWEKAVNSLLTEGFADIYITGSNSRMLSSELATLLAGRYVQTSMLPLGFREFLEFRATRRTEDLDYEFELFLKYGGLPGIHSLPLEEEVVFQFLNAIYNTVLVKDVTTRHQIRDVAQFEKITRYLFDKCGNVTTAKRITDFFRSQAQRVSVDTVQSYMGFLQDAHLIYKCSRYDIKGKRHLELYEKYYACDLGIRHSVLGYRKNDIAGVLENIVFLELLRRGYRVSTGKVGDLEVDFIAEKDGQKKYFQVCYLLASAETEEREFTSLEKIDDNYPKVVLSMDKHWGSNRNGIARQHVYDFLLGHHNNE